MVKKMVVPVPKNLDEAASFLMKIGQEQRTIGKIKSRLNTKVDKLQATAVTEAQVHQLEISRLVEGLFAYAEVHRDELTDGGKHKTVSLPTGIFGWRKTPPKVSLRGIESILENIHALKLNRFIRSKEEVDKKAMLKEPAIARGIKGVSITQHEEFIAKPAELEVEIVTKVAKLKKAASK